MESDKVMNILAVCTSSIFQHFESYLRNEVDLVEDVIRMILDENSSSFKTYELPPGIYVFRDFCEV